MKKQLSLLFICVIVTALLTGCHGSREHAVYDTSVEFNEQTPIEITFWAKNDTNKTQADIYNQAIADFEKQYPNITVNLRLYTDYGKIYNDVITNIATDTTPNVCITYPDHIATYLTGNNTVLSLDEIMMDENYGLGGGKVKFDSVHKDEIVEKFLNECMIDGKIYALPYMRSSEACYINKTYVEALGYEIPEVLTWDFIWEVSEKAMEQDANGNYVVNGQKVLIPFIYKSTDNMLITMLKQTGGAYSDENGNVAMFNDDTKAFLSEVYSHAKTGAFSTFKISGYPANFLNAGQCIFAIDSTAGATWMGSDAPLADISEDAFVDFETVVKTVPQFDPDNPYMMSQGPSICVFNKADSQEVLASWLFAQFLLTNEVQVAYAETEGYVPVTTKAQMSDEYQDYLNREGEDSSTYYNIKILASKLILDNIDNTFVTAVFNGSTSLRDAATTLVEDTTKAARRNKEFDDEFVNKLYSDTISLYRLEDMIGDVVVTEKVFPTESKLLLGSLIGIWLVMGFVFISDYIKSRDE